MRLTAVYENDVKWWDDTDSRLALYQYNVVEPYPSDQLHLSNNISVQ